MIFLKQISNIYRNKEGVKLLTELSTGPSSYAQVIGELKYVRVCIWSNAAEFYIFPGIHRNWDIVFPGSIDTIASFNNAEEYMQLLDIILEYTRCANNFVMPSAA